MSISNRRLVLSLLRQAGDRGVTTSEFLQAGCGNRFGGRLYELRQQGHVIEAERLNESAYLYRLTHDAGGDGSADVAAQPEPEILAEKGEELAQLTGDALTGLDQIEAAPPRSQFPRPLFMDPDDEEEAA